jgi:hypothetical protein
LKAEGTEFFSEPQVMKDGSSFVCFKDSDGTILEFIQFPQTSKQAEA